MSDTIDRDGVRIHYEVRGTGTGTPILLTHGFAATARMFASTLQALAPSRRCIAWDVRGHGDSDYPEDARLYSVPLALGDMLAILGAEQVGCAVLLGHSLGGYLSLELQRVHPERVAALVLVGTGPGYRNDDARAGWNDMCETYATALDTKGVAGLPSISDEVQADAHRDVTGLVHAARGILRQHDARVLDNLPRIDIPTLVVVGEHDRPFLASGSYLAAKIPNARHVVIEGAGHAPMITHPDVFHAEVRAFLEQVDRST